MRFLGMSPNRETFSMKMLRRLELRIIARAVPPLLRFQRGQLLRATTHHAPLRNCIAARRFTNEVNPVAHGKAEQDSKEANRSWKKFIPLATAVGILGITMYKYLSTPNAPLTTVQTSSSSMSYGELVIGGPFELVDSNGKVVTDKDLLGKFVLVYFGFTNCPDICPAELTKITKVLQNLGHKARDFTPVFISVDPKRDTPSVIGEYVKEFDPRIVGLTGTREQVDKVCKAYRVYYSSSAVDENDEDYLVDHSTVIFLLNPQGKVVEYFHASETSDAITRKLLDRLNKASRT